MCLIFFVLLLKQDAPREMKLIDRVLSCMMCTGLIQLSRIRRLYYGPSDPKGGCIETVIHVKQIPHLNTYPKEIYADIMKEECSEILTTFFKEKRNRNKHKNHT